MNKLNRILTNTVFLASVIAYPHAAQAQSTEEIQNYLCAGFTRGALIQRPPQSIPQECLEEQYQSQPNNYYRRQPNNYYPRDIDAYVREQNRRARQIKRRAEWLNQPDPVCLSCSSY